MPVKQQWWYSFLMHICVNEPQLVKNTKLCHLVNLGTNTCRSNCWHCLSQWILLENGFTQNLICCCQIHKLSFMKMLSKMLIMSWLANSWQILQASKWYQYKVTAILQLEMPLGYILCYDLYVPNFSCASHQIFKGIPFRVVLLFLVLDYWCNKARAQMSVMNLWCQKL